MLTTNPILLQYKSCISYIKSYLRGINSKQKISSIIALLLVLFISTPAIYLHSHHEHLEAQSKVESLDFLAFTQAHHDDSCELCDLDLLSLFDDSLRFVLLDVHSWSDKLPLARVEACFVTTIGTSSPRGPPACL